MATESDTPTPDGDDLPNDDLVNTVRGDRHWLAARFRAATPAAAPAQALCFTVLIASPASGWSWTSVVVFALAIAGLIGIEVAFRRHLGVSIDLPAGARSWAVVIALTIIVVALGFASAILGLLGLGLGVFAACAVGFVTTLLGVIAYDRVYAADLTRSVGTSPPLADRPFSGEQLRIAAFLRPLTSARMHALDDAWGTDRAASAALADMERAGHVTITANSAARAVSLTSTGRQVFDRQWPAASPA